MTKRELIFNAGAKLFAKKTFDSVGIRDIAAEAGVNSAMISYYFGSKNGLLRDIFSNFSTILIAQLQKALEESTDQMNLCENTVRRLLSCARSNPDLNLVGLRELNKDTVELQDLRKEMHDRGWQIYSQHLKRLNINATRGDDDKDITFTALMGLVFSDYLLGGGALIESDEQVETYTSIIVKILQSGMLATWN